MQWNIALLTRKLKKGHNFKKEYVNAFSLNQWTNSIANFKKPVLIKYKV